MMFWVIDNGQETCFKFEPPVDAVTVTTSDGDEFVLHDMETLARESSWVGSTLVSDEWMVRRAK